MYISAIWLGDIECNPKTQNLSLWMQHNLSFIIKLNANPPLLDSLLFLGLILALFGTFFMLKEKKSKTIAVEQTLYIYSVLIAVLIFITVDVTKWFATSFWGVYVGSNGFPSWNYGFPTWTYQVTTLTAFYKYPDYSSDNPNVYFLNYWQLFTITISIAITARLLIKRQENVAAKNYHKSAIAVALQKLRQLLHRII